MRQCPECGSDNINRIGLYEFSCEDCGNVFDIAESNDTNDDFLDSIENCDDEF